MRRARLYKNWLICAESFQREKNGPWVSQYLVSRKEGEKDGYPFPSLQYQLNDVFWTEEEADDFAVSKAKEWIDQPGA
jgi:hypothetical protein